MVLKMVLAERERQDTLWGDQSHHPDAWWNVIATEENGEVAKEVYEIGLTRWHGGESADSALLEEIIQACAVYFAWAEAVTKRLYGDDFINEENG